MAGTTTVLRFDPNQTNCQTDAEYLADSNRADGFGTDAIWPSPLANKILSQSSNYLYSLFTAFAQKGFTTNDDNVPLLTAVCANFLTTADILPGVVSVAYSPTPTFNAGASNGFQMTLSGNVTASTISGLTPGQLIAFYFTQDSVGGRTIVFPASFVGGIQPDPTANSVSLQMFRVDLSGIPYAVTPMMSSTGLAKFNSITLASPGTAGQVLTNVGGVFVPAPLSSITGSVSVPAGGPISGSTTYSFTATLSAVPPAGSVVIWSLANGSTLSDSAGIVLQMIEVNGATVTMSLNNSWAYPQGWNAFTLNFKVI